MLHHGSCHLVQDLMLDRVMSGHGDERNGVVVAFCPETLLVGCRPKPLSEDAEQARKDLERLAIIREKRCVPCP